MPMSSKAPLRKPPFRVRLWLPVPGETSLDSKHALKEINARRERVASQGRELSCEMSQQRSVIAKKIPARFDLQLLRSPDQGRNYSDDDCKEENEKQIICPNLKPGSLPATTHPQWSRLFRSEPLYDCV